ncbi:MAG TPA: hypothetical protein H9675_01880 [Firmicutes bacterium]|nr:hypothetical protein [Bacillota bacterium]
MRYGENPHQKAAFHKEIDVADNTIPVYDRQKNLLVPQQ